jgi:hypothetical protein
MFNIIVNSICLGNYDYANPESDYWGNVLNSKLEILFTIVFTLEATIKIIAYGLITSKGCYL